MDNQKLRRVKEDRSVPLDQQFNSLSLLINAFSIKVNIKFLQLEKHATVNRAHQRIWRGGSEGRDTKPFTKLCPKI